LGGTCILTPHLVFVAFGRVYLVSPNRRKVRPSWVFQLLTAVVWVGAVDLLLLAPLVQQVLDHEVAPNIAQLVPPILLLHLLILDVGGGLAFDGDRDR